MYVLAKYQLFHPCQGCPSCVPRMTGWEVVNRVVTEASGLGALMMCRSVTVPCKIASQRRNLTALGQDVTAGVPPGASPKLTPHLPLQHLTIAQQCACSWLPHQALLTGGNSQRGLVVIINSGLPEDLGCTKGSSNSWMTSSVGQVWLTYWLFLINWCFEWKLKKIKNWVIE